jgi:hypothetical protein
MPQMMFDMRQIKSHLRHLMSIMRTLRGKNWVSSIKKAKSFLGRIFGGRDGGIENLEVRIQNVRKLANFDCRASIANFSGKRIA